jgi:hypothetical protein
MPPMTTDIDYARKFVDQDGQRYQLWFRTDHMSYGDPKVDNPTGQIIATVMNYGAADHGREHPISRPHIRFNDAEAAVDRAHLPYLQPGLYDLKVIQDRLAAANLS